MIIVKHKSHHIAPQLIEAFVTTSFCSVVFEDSADDFDLNVDPRMLKFGEPVFNVMLLAHHIKGVSFVFGPQVLRKQFISIYAPIFCKNFRYFKRTMGDQIFQKCT
ncbi:hypothetical protein P618_200753 [Holospora obtusa F1]|uniref:Uncharacterized protein n=1 Tax=Holospora obtusa F1 TaxID=1399147 RepID=W6TDZ1_HOLOB|nr:hypothetical protein [Holospora obtusa]ETZ07071.1 hypothetical protein P618_200753 [Holospora obtusa F1]